MRRGIGIFLLSASLLLISCGTSEKEDLSVSSVPAEETETAEETAEAEKSHSLIVYFSLAGEQYGVGRIKEGNTAILADFVEEKTGADTFEIVPVNSYPDDLQGLMDVTEKEQETGALPDYVGDVENWEEYTDVYIGYPLWYDTLPRIVIHFLQDHDFSGKTIYPFNTSAAEGLLGTVDTIRSICTGAEVKEGLTVRGSVVQNDRDTTEQAVDDWLLETSQQE